MSEQPETALVSEDQNELTEKNVNQNSTEDNQNEKSEGKGEGNTNDMKSGNGENDNSGISETGTKFAELQQVDDGEITGESAERNANTSENEVASTEQRGDPFEEAPTESTETLPPESLDANQNSNPEDKNVENTEETTEVAASVEQENEQPNTENENAEVSNENQEQPPPNEEQEPSTTEQTETQETDRKGSDEENEKQEETDQTLVQDNPTQEQDGTTQDDTALEQDDTTQKQDNPTQEQDDTTEKHDDTTEKHDDTTQEQDDTTEKHDDTAEKHDDTTEKHDDTTQEQDVTIHKEHDTALEQDDATLKQDDTTQEQDDTIQKHDDTTQEQDVTIQEQDTAQKPDDATQEQDDATQEQDDTIQDTAQKPDDTTQKQDDTTKEQNDTEYIQESKEEDNQENTLSEIPVAPPVDEIPVAPPVDANLLPSRPQLMSPDANGTESSLEGTMSNSALNIIWSFGLNRDVPVLNLTDEVRKMILYACAHVGVLYDFQNNKQHILQGHTNPITCSCVSDDKRWLVTGDKGEDAMVIIWDTYSGIPIQTLFDLDQEGGVEAVALTPDARYLATLSSSRNQVLSIWDWTIDGESPICTAKLNPDYGIQNFIYFNPEDFHYLVTNSNSQVIFCHWDERCLEYFAPPLTDQDFNKHVGNYSQSIFQSNSSRALTATSVGNLVVWDNNKPLTKVISTEQSADKKALKIIKLQERGINVLTTTDKYIVVGDMAGHVKFFDQTLKLIYWYQDFHLGPVTSVSFSHSPEFVSVAPDGSDYPGDATISAKNFVIRDFVVGTNIAIFGNVTADGTKVEVIHREHDAAIHALAAHPQSPYLVIGSYSGLIQIWNYENKKVMVSRTFERGQHIRCCAFDPKGEYLAVGFTNGSIRILDALTLNEEQGEPFHYSKDAVTHLVFSHNSIYLAAADAEYVLTVYKKQCGSGDLFDYLGRHRAHYKSINDVLFGIHLDSNLPRLMSLGEDRVLVEYDLVSSVRDNLVIASSDRIEQSGVPKCMAWYPPITKEHFLVTANDQFKFKLFNATTKMCRKTLLGPTYGSPVLRVEVLPTDDPAVDKRYIAYHTEDKVGLNILPLDGNPHNSMALIAHPSGVSNLVCSYDGKYLFTAGGSDSAVHMWEINKNALEAQSKLGGEELLPFYGLLDGGREGELFAELEDYFYYAQIRNQGVDSQETRNVSVKISVNEIPFVMRALGFYPSEQEIEDMMNEVKFSEYVETGEYVEQINLGDFIKLYVNHRPAFGLSPDKVEEAFQILGFPTGEGSAIDRGELLDILQSKGEHITEYELAEYLSTLLGHNVEGGSSELHQIDPVEAGELIDKHLPHQITSDMFSQQILGFSMYSDVMTNQ